MTLLRIPSLATGRASVRLVTSPGHLPIIGFDGDEWATRYEYLDLSAEQTIELTPTADIAIDGGGATCYQITLTASGGRSEDWFVQVPDSETTQELTDLVGAAAIDPADIAAELVAQVADDAAAAAADRIQTGLDAIATAADRVQTGIDAAAVSGAISAAIVVIADDGPLSITVGVGEYALISEGTDPYPYIVLQAEVA